MLVSATATKQPVAPAGRHAGDRVQGFSCCLGHPTALQTAVHLALVVLTSASAAGCPGFGLTVSDPVPAEAVEVV